MRTLNSCLGSWLFLFRFKVVLSDIDELCTFKPSNTEIQRIILHVVFFFYPSRTVYFRVTQIPFGSYVVSNIRHERIDILTFLPKIYDTHRAMSHRGSIVLLKKKINK